MLRLGAGLAVALTMLAGTGALAQTAKPVGKGQTGAASTAPEHKNGAPAAATPPPAPDVWTPAEIQAAKAQCAAAIKGLNVLVSYEEPIKDGECGNPAPIRLVKLDNVSFQPAALINCGMLAPLHKWITKDIQPLARRQLGAKIATIEVMSDYSCRTALGRKGKKLSQHAYVDALDIRGFITDKSQQVLVLENWGATARDIAAAKAREEKIVQAAHAAAAAQAAAEAQRPEAAPAPAAKQPPSKPGAPASHARGDVDVVAAILPGGNKRQQVAARLGGPPENSKPAAGTAKPTLKPSVMGDQRIAPLSRAALAALKTPNDTPSALFLRDAHAAACRTFGTTLGPEANEMHRNHFHIDMAKRTIKSICD
jgi:hypothetical protein